VGENISVPVMISIATGIFVIVANWNNIFTTFVYGVGKLRIQVVYSIFTAILNIPLSIFLAKTIGLGITGVMIATIICLIFSSLLSPLQYFKLINGKTKGIWNK
jgi:Na+-driven multidrug efflux pump